MDDPRTTTTRPWLVSVAEEPFLPPHRPTGGKWLLHFPPEKINGWWRRLVSLQRGGQFPYHLRCSTVTHPYTAEEDSYIICIYTYDFLDLEDVLTARFRLREIGVEWRIPYRRDYDIRAVEDYAPSAIPRLSKYYQ